MNHFPENVNAETNIALRLKMSFMQMACSYILTVQPRPNST